MHHHKNARLPIEELALLEKSTDSPQSKPIHSNALQVLSLDNNKSNIVAGRPVSTRFLTAEAKKAVPVSTENEVPKAPSSNLSFNYTKMDMNKRMSLPYTSRGPVEDLESLQKLRQMRNSNKRNTHAIKVYNQQEKTQQASKLTCMYSAKNLR